jgi:putative tRNA adenosine deaminase-associated protein
MACDRSVDRCVGRFDLGNRLAANRSLCHIGSVTTVDEADDGVDLAVAAYHDGDEWQVADLAHDHLTDIETLADALRRLPGDEGALAMVAVDEDFFILVRVSGSRTQVLLSDVTAAEEWDLATSAVEHLENLGLSIPDDEDDAVPAGHLDLLIDLGVPEAELSELLEEMLDDDELYPDEMLSDLARLLGFGEEFDDVVGLTSA